MNMLNLYIVRHGKTLFNKKHLIQGVCDSPLVAEGVEQAQQLQESLQSVPFVSCYVSPLNRAVQTADIITEGRNIPTFINNNLEEFNFGSIEGDSEEKLISIYPVLSGKHVDGFDGEDMTEFTSRIITALDEIRKNNSDGNVLVVTHSGVITALLNTLTTLPKEEIIHVQNCSVTKFKWEYGWKLIH